MKTQDQLKFTFAERIGLLTAVDISKFDQRMTGAGTKLD
jgi:hypothetical protein